MNDKDIKALLTRLGLTGAALESGSGEWIDVANPATGAVLARVRGAASAGYERVMARAVDAALAWRAVPAPKRGEAVRLLGEALRQITVNPTPVLHAAVIDPALRQWDTPPPERLDDALAYFDSETSSLADAIDHVPVDSWTRTGSVAGGGSVTAITVARDAVREGRKGLEDIERTLAAVRD